MNSIFPRLILEGVWVKNYVTRAVGLLRRSCLGRPILDVPWGTPPVGLGRQNRLVTAIVSLTGNFFPNTLFVIMAGLLWSSLARSEPSESTRLTKLRPGSTVLPNPTVATHVVERHATLMGTDIDILVDAPDSPKVQSALDAALAEISRIEELMTDWRETGEVAAVNRQAGIQPVLVSTELLDLLDQAKDVSVLTQGAFDVTWKGGSGCWDLAARPFRIPEAAAIAEARSRIGYTRLVLDRAANTAFLKDKGMAMGLGGIAKGYAVDRASALLRERGLTRHVVNAGGDLYASGKHEGRLWQIGIKDPRDPRENLAVLPVANMAVVTSGDYERFVVVDGVRYSHILDPRTGSPARGCESVTVMAATAAFADALATGVFVLGPSEGMKLIDSLPEVEGLIVDADGNLSFSKGFTPAAPPARKPNP